MLQAKLTSCAAGSYRLVKADGPPAGGFFAFFAMPSVKRLVSLRAPPALLLHLETLYIALRLRAADTT
jgi:hypothetical protein